MSKSESTVSSVQSTIKFCHAEKGYALATSDEGDLFIPPNIADTCRLSLQPGARLKAAYCTSEKGLRVTQIISIEKPMFFRGVIKFFNRVKGYGFIVSPSFDVDIFLAAAVAAHALIEPQEGLSLEFQVEKGSKGLVASGIRATGA